MLSFSFRSLSFKLPLTQKRQFYISVEISEGAPRITETVMYMPRGNVAIFSETLEFLVRNPQENTFFHLEIHEHHDDPSKRQRISRETFHINKLKPNKFTQLILPTTFGTKAIVDFTLEVSSEFNQIIADQENTLDKDQTIRREQALNIDKFNPLKMGPLMYEFVFALSPLVLLKTQVINFFTWKNPHVTFLGSFLFSIFLLFNQTLTGLGLIGFFLLSRKLIPVMIQMKPMKDEVKGGLNIYKRNLEIMRELMQVTVWVDEMQNKLFNNPDKTLLLHFLLTIKKFSLALGIFMIVGNLHHIILIAFWTFLLYNTGTGKTVILRAYDWFGSIMEFIEYLIMPAIKLEDKIFASQLKMTAKRSFSNSSIGSFTETDSPVESMSPVPQNSQKQKVVNQKTFVTYENQRWWLGKGWCRKMFSDERPAWSDDLGQVPITMDTFNLPNNSWKWEGEWNYVIGPNTDKEGWEYADNFKAFNSGNSGKSLVNIVRRRKWVRRCVEIES